MTTNAGGQKVAELRYLPFGETRWAWGVTPTDRRYTGQREVPAIGLYDYNARMYWPAAGRFVSADSIVPRPGNPQNLNRYAYTLNNPLRYNDPTGHDVGCSGRDASHCSSYNRRRSSDLRPLPRLSPMTTATPKLKCGQDGFCRYSPGIVQRAEQILADFNAGTIFVQRRMDLPFDSPDNTRADGARGYVCGDVVRDAYEAGGLPLDLLMQEYFGPSYDPTYGSRNAIQVYDYLVGTAGVHEEEQGYAAIVPGDIVFTNFDKMEGRPKPVPYHMGLVVDVRGETPDLIWVIQASYSQDKVVKQTLREFRAAGGPVAYGHPLTVQQQ